MRRARVVMVTAMLWVLFAAPARAQITDPPVTDPPTTQPPVTEPPVTEPPPTEAPKPTTTRPRSTTTKPTTTVPATTTSLRLLPPPSVAPQDPSAAPIGSRQSSHISSVFVWLSIIGFLTLVGLLVAQWFLTRPGRHGWTI